MYPKGNFYHVLTVKRVGKFQVMKMRRRLLAIRKESRISIPKENIWFFSEGTTSQSSVSEKKSVRNDRQSILNDDYDRYSLNKSVKSSAKRGNSFVVDWQMSDAF